MKSRKSKSVFDDDYDDNHDGVLQNIKDYVTSLGVKKFILMCVVSVILLIGLVLLVKWIWPVLIKFVWFCFKCYIVVCIIMAIGIMIMTVEKENKLTSQTIVNPETCEEDEETKIASLIRCVNSKIENNDETVLGSVRTITFIEVEGNATLIQSRDGENIIIGHGDFADSSSVARKDRNGG